MEPPPCSPGQNGAGPECQGRFENGDDIEEGEDEFTIVLGVCAMEIKVGSIASLLTVACYCVIKMGWVMNVITMIAQSIASCVMMRWSSSVHIWIFVT